MKEKAKITLPKIGYLYHYPRLDHPTDNFRLDIFVASLPTELHFDVQHALFFTTMPDETIEKITVTHPWTYKNTAQVCAGVVVMEDRNKEKKEAFTFGGNLKIKTEESQTICTLTSSAPILEINDSTPLKHFFVEELEMLLAEQRATHLDHHDYEKQLGNADPRELYLACLEALRQKFEDFPHKDEKNREFFAFLNAEKRRLYAAGISTDLTPSLDEIFSSSKE